MSGYTPINITIDENTRSQLLGVISINGGDNIQMDNSSSLIHVVQDPSFNTLVVNGDMSANTAHFSGDVNCDTINTKSGQDLLFKNNTTITYAKLDSSGEFHIKQYLIAQISHG